MKGTPTLVFVLIGIASAAALGFAIYAGARMAAPAMAFWPGTTIACIPGHTNLAMHFHPEIEISVDGAPEMVPANIGISSQCMAEVHTHEADGVMHVESAEEGRVFTVADFFMMWGSALERPGYNYTATVNAEPVEDIAAHVMNDLDKITIAYTTGPNVSASTSVPESVSSEAEVSFPPLTQ